MSFSLCLGYDPPRCVYYQIHLRQFQFKKEQKTCSWPAAFLQCFRYWTMLYAKIMSPKLQFWYCTIHNCSVPDAGRLIVHCAKMWVPYSFLSHIFHFHPSRSLSVTSVLCALQTQGHMCNSSAKEILVNVNFDMCSSIWFSIPNGSKCKTALLAAGDSL